MSDVEIEQLQNSGSCTLGGHSITSNEVFGLSCLLDIYFFRSESDTMLILRTVINSTRLAQRDRFWF